MLLKTLLMKNYSRFLMVLGAGLSFLVLTVTGCTKNNESTPASGQTNVISSTTQNNAGLITAGKIVYNDNGCMRCHAISGQGGDNAPDLTRVGAKAERTTEWLVAHVKNPKVHNPRSPMPAFEGKINDKDLQALGAYLASLK